MKTMYGRYIDYNSYLYKLVYIITIKDEAHKNLLCVNDTLVDIDLVTDVNMPNLEPDSEELNQLALEIIARSDKFKGFPVQLLHTELAIYRLLEDENGNERALVLSACEIERLLENAGIPQKLLSDSSKEWFEVDITTVVNILGIARSALLYFEEPVLCHEKKKFQFIETKQLVGYNSYPLERFHGNRLDALCEEVRGLTENLEKMLGIEEDDESLGKTLDSGPSHEIKIKNPLVVRPKAKELYEILHGHYRAAAALKLQVPVVPCVIVEDLSEEEALAWVSDLNPVGLLKKYGIDIFDPNFRISDGYTKLKNSLVTVEGDVSMALDEYIIKELLTPQEVMPLFKSIYSMGNPRELSAEECKSEAIAKEIARTTPPATKSKAEQISEEDWQELIEISPKERDDWAKKIERDHFRNLEGRGIIYKLKKYVNYDLTLYEDGNDSQVMREKAKLFYFLFTLNKELQSAGFQSVDIYELLSKPTMENIDQSAFGWITQNGEYLRYLKHELEMEIPYSLKSEIKKHTREAVDMLGGVMEHGKAAIELAFKLGNDCAGFIKQQKQRMEQEVPPSIDVPPAYSLNPLGLFYLRLVQHEYLGEQMDILRMLELRSRSKPLIKQQYQNELIQHESINVIEGSYVSLFNQENRAKIEDFFAPKNVREIAKYIYPGETVTSEMRRKIRKCEEKIFKILKAFRLSDPYSIHNQEISELFLISCIQCIIHECDGTFNYDFHHQEGEKTYRKGKIGLHTVHKGDEPRADALLYYWIRMIMDYSYMNTGEYECQQLMQEYEELVLEALGKVLQCNSLYEMNCMCNHYVNLLDISW